VSKETGLTENTINTLASTAVSRRRFLVGSSVAAGLVVLTAACGNDDDDTDTGAGRPAVTAPTAALKPTVDAAAAKLTDVPGAATLALRLEDYASQTYQSVIPTLKSPDAIKLAAQITVVGSQHQAILRYVLGLYPVGSGPMKAANGLANVDFAPSSPTPALITG